MKKLITLLLICTMLAGCFAGCVIYRPGQSAAETTKLVVGCWPKETDGVKWEQWNRYREEFMTLNPDIEIIPDESGYDSKTYLLSAATGQIPMLYHTYYTEVDRIIASGFAKDVTQVAKERGWYDAYSDKTKELVFRNDRMYLIPTSCYSMSLQINKNVFEAAGLVNEDGSCMIPNTYGDVVTFSRIIKEKTGAYGFMIPTSGVGAGWHFVNIAWSFGTTFMENMDGQWQATFSSPECTAALQWLKDMKHAYGLLPDSTGISSGELSALFSSNQLGMRFVVPGNQGVDENEGFSKDDVVYAAVPEGPASRTAQMGGTNYVIDRNASDEQVEAAFRWLEFLGYGPTLSEEAKANIVEEYDTMLAENYVVGLIRPTVWKEDSEKRQYEKRIIADKTNVDRRNFIHYETVAVELHPEDPVNFQELYQILGDCIQKILRDKDSDPAEVLEKAAAKFQKEYLNEINYQ